jgi:hypothetical protein
MQESDIGMVSPLGRQARRDAVRKTVNRHTAVEDQVVFDALVRFTSVEEAFRAHRQMQGSFLLNLPVRLRVLP